MRVKKQVRDSPNGDSTGTYLRGVVTGLSKPTQWVREITDIRLVLEGLYARYGILFPLSGFHVAE